MLASEHEDFCAFQVLVSTQGSQLGTPMKTLFRESSRRMASIAGVSMRAKPARRIILVCYWGGSA